MRGRQVEALLDTLAGKTWVPLVEFPTFVSLQCVHRDGQRSYWSEITLNIRLSVPRHRRLSFRREVALLRRAQRTVIKWARGNGAWCEDYGGMVYRAYTGYVADLDLQAVHCPSSIELQVRFEVPTAWPDLRFNRVKADIARLAERALLGPA